MPIKSISENAIVEFSAYVTDHSPLNKRSIEVHNARARITVRDYDGSRANSEPWTEITIDETYMNRGSEHPVNRTLSITLSPEQRKEFTELLSR